MHEERAERRNDDEVRQDEGPTAGPCPPEAAAQIGDEYSDLDRERAGKRLADGDGLAHLLLGEPFLVVDELPFHLADQGDRFAEAEKAQSEKIAHHLAHLSAL